MHIVSTYKTKIIETEYNSCFHATVEWYRKAVSFFIPVVLAEWDWLAMLSGTSLLSFVEFLSAKTKDEKSSTTLDIYSHLSTTGKHETAQAMNRLLS